MLDLLVGIFAVYIMTAVIVNGNVCYTFREWFKQQTPQLFKGNPPRHLIDCRMCTSAYLALFVTLFMPHLYDFFLVYGASYFLATQER